MAESIVVPSSASRQQIYAALLPQIKALIAGETDLVANQANIVAALKEALNFLWVGFYWVKGHQLVLGPFQGPVACTRIDFGRGVCGKAYRTQQTIVVPDVDQFPGHIACSTRSKSEIVVPVIGKSGEVLGVLDVDSERLHDFSEIDVKALEAVTQMLAVSIAATT